MSDPVPTPTQPTLTREERDKAICIDISHCVSPSQIAKKYHVSFTTISALRKGSRLNPASQANRKKDLPAKLYEIAELAVLAITPEKLKAASAPQLVTTAAIAIDKARLMEGLSTENMDIRAVVPKIEEQLRATSEAHAQVIEMIRQRSGDYVPAPPSA